MKEKERKGILKKILITILCIIINLIGKYIADLLNLPVWFDMAGTCLAVYFLGLFWGILAALMNNIIYGIVNPVSFYYSITGIVLSLLVYYCIKKGCFREFSKTLISGFWIGVICTVVSFPVNMLASEGYSGNMWGDALFEMLEWQGFPKIICAIAGQGLVEIVDKQACILLAYGIILLVKAGKEKGKGEKAGKEGTDKENNKSADRENVKKDCINKDNKVKISMVLLIAAIILQYSLIPSLINPGSMGMGRVNAMENDALSDNYLGTIYNSSSGMMSSEANVIEETEDGYIWIGSYAGLTRYDGNEFKFIRESGLSSITCMMTDSRGRLWIGTNDSGAARYENGEFTFFTMENGLPVNSIRSFAENEEGIVYIGTTDKICKLDSSDSISVIDEELFYVISMVCYKQLIIGVDNNGELFGLNEDGSLADAAGELKENFCNCVQTTTNGIMAGTSGNLVYTLDVENGEIIIKARKTAALSDVLSIEEDEMGRIWLCAEAGLGYYDENGVFHNEACEGFDSSMEWIHEDYQGNIWVASSRYGILKLSKSRFVDAFSKYGLDNSVVNAVTLYNGAYYYGTDSGLLIVDKQSGQKVENALTDYLKEIRIRCEMVDSHNRLWLCSYGETGLICYDGAGNITSYNTVENVISSDRTRCIIEMKDGTIVVGTSDGINFIEDGKVTGMITLEDGLLNSQILSMAEGEDGLLYAGSDGGGLYVIKDKKIQRCYTTKDGLSSDVILRTVPYDGGLFLVTSNSLCYMKDGIRVLENFPYFNNYDIMIDGESAYIMSSAGVYVVKVSELLGEGELSYRLYNVNEGLLYALTANSWNYLDEEGVFHLCCNSGVAEFSEEERGMETEYKFGVASALCDDTEIFAKEDCFNIPSSVKRITLSPSVRNYALKDIKVKFYIEEMENDPDAVSYKDLEPMQISNLASGKYHLHFEILDSDQDNILQEHIYTIEKEKHVWEKAWFRIYLILVCIEVVAFITWSIVIMFLNTKRKAELEVLRQELVEKVDEQTKEIRAQQKKTEELYMQTVAALSEAVEAKDRYTSGHSRRVAEYSRRLAGRLGKSREEQEEIYRAGLLHDVGKIRIPEEIINKPGKLTDEEFELIKIHPVTGYHILRGISDNKMIAMGAKFHHERYDGKGYPNGLQGENIPEIARIIGVADTYDAMTSNRSYRKVLPQDKVRSEIENGRGTQFDPLIADEMLKMIDEDKGYKMRHEMEGKKNILVVDDEEMNIEMTRLILKDEVRYEILGAESGNKALFMLKKNKIDLILLDAKMPGMDGFETLEKIRESYSVPVVLMTADKDIGIIEKAAAMNVDDYLTKPFLPIALREIVYSMLNCNE